MALTFCITVLPMLWHALTYSKASGEVKNFEYFEEFHGRGTANLPHPLVNFTVEGKNYSFYGTDVQKDELNPGDGVDLIYDPKYPSHAYIYSWTGFWSSPLFYFIPAFIIFSAVLLSVGLLPRILIIKL